MLVLIAVAAAICRTKATRQANSIAHFCDSHQRNGANFKLLLPITITGQLDSPLGHTDIYIGISSLSICGQVSNATGTEVYDPGCQSIEWSDNDCEQSSVGDHNDACKECKSTTSTLTVFVIMSAFAMAGSISDKVDRLYAKNDLNCVKGFGFFTAVLGTVAPLAQILPFQTICVDNLPTEVMGQNITWNGGPGFAFVIISLIINCIVGVSVHTTVPTPKEIQQEGYKMGQRGDTDGENKENDDAKSGDDENMPNDQPKNVQEVPLQSIA